MQAVILAAGMATRLRPLTDTSPKCLLEIEGQSILERAVRNVLACSIEDFVIVTGYRADMIRDFIGEKFPDLRCVFVHNPRYAETNNAYSLQLAEKAIEGDFLLLDSDILFPSELVRSLLDEVERPCIAINRHPCSEEEMKIRTGPDGYVADIGKDIRPDGDVAESIGFEIFDGSSRRQLFQVLSRRVHEEKKENEFYEASFKELIGYGMKLKTVDTTSHPAIEIDTVQDLEQARALARA